jgi:uncharacterized protein YjiS (DUF1127 family)
MALQSAVAGGVHLATQIGRIRLSPTSVASSSIPLIRAGHRTDGSEFHRLQHIEEIMAMITNRMTHGFLVSYRGSSPRPSLWAAAGGAVGNLVMTLLDWQERARQRRQLLDLDSAALKDFGRNLADAAREGTKPFWRA